MKQFPAIMIFAALLTACGTTAASPSTHASSFGSKVIGVGGSNAASNVSTLGSGQRGSTHPDAAGTGTTRVIAPAAPQPAAAVPPAGGTGCGQDSGFGKARPLCIPE